MLGKEQTAHATLSFFSCWIINHFHTGKGTGFLIQNSECDGLFYMSAWLGQVTWLSHDTQISGLGGCHLYGCHCEGTSYMWLTFNSENISESLSLMWVDILQSVEGLNRKRLKSPKEGGILPPDSFQTRATKPTLPWVSSLLASLQISYLPVPLPPPVTTHTHTHTFYCFCFSWEPWLIHWSWVWGPRLVSWLLVGWLQSRCQGLRVSWTKSGMLRLCSEHI